MADGILYRFFDSQGGLLYIGITDLLVGRVLAHQQDKPWFGEVASITMERHPTRSALAEAERRAIRAEGPVHNQIRYAGSTKLKTVRVNDELWQAAKAVAERSGETLTSVVLAALRDYVSEDV